MPTEPLILLVVSTLVVASIFVKAGVAPRLRVPPVVGFLGLGVLLRVVDAAWKILPDEGVWTLDLLAELGVAALLFQVGLKSDPRGLLDELPHALPVWASDVIVSAGLALAFGLAFGLGLVPSLFAAAALSATSVGISVVVWEDTNRLRSPLGELLVDVAELDDLSAVLLMLTVVAIAPGLHAGGAPAELAGAAAASTAVLLVKVAAFAGACWVFARWLEPRFTAWIGRRERPPDRVLSIVGVAFGIAALAGLIGFSVAVGALFAGLLFSGDPRAVREEASFTPIHALFTPFFFIDVGYAVDPGALGGSLALGAGFAVPAVLGKLVGVGAPVAARRGLRAGVLLGLSMLPRAEIAMLVARTGHRLGPWAVPDALYGGIVLAAAFASVVSPPLLQPLLGRWSDVVDGPGQGVHSRRHHD